MTEIAVTLEVARHIGWITLNRPDAMNAFNDPVREGIIATVQAARDDPLVRVLVIRAAGSKAFSVGADVKERRERETPAELRDRMKQKAWSEAVAACPKPVIASVHGYCMGGGLELALACDIRIAAPNAIFALPEVNLGLLPGGGGTQRLPRLIGAAQALDLMLTGARLDANRALQLGLITRMSATNESLAADTESLAAMIAAKPPLATQHIKKACLGGLDLSLADGLRLERELFLELAASEDRAEATAAFREKRAGQFVGR